MSLIRQTFTLSQYFLYLHRSLKSWYANNTSYVEKFAILGQCQFGVRKDRSNEQAISEITDNLKQAIDNNLLTGGVFLDFAKAVDTVSDDILLNKLQKSGIWGLPLSWFTIVI